MAHGEFQAIKGKILVMEENFPCYLGIKKKAARRPQESAAANTQQPLKKELHIFIGKCYPHSHSSIDSFHQLIIPGHFQIIAALQIKP